ncbi:MAG: hypothetical protein AABM67_07085 [Acidobacteriota bacterium]
MKEIKRFLIAVLIGAVFVVGGVFAQKGSNNNTNRPPKDPGKVVDKQKPPPSNSNKKPE